MLGSPVSGSSAPATPDLFANESLSSSDSESSGKCLPGVSPASANESPITLVLPENAPQSKTLSESDMRQAKRDSRFVNGEHGGKFFGSNYEKELTAFKESEGGQPQSGPSIFSSSGVPPRLLASITNIKRTFAQAGVSGPAAGDDSIKRQKV